MLLLLWTLTPCILLLQLSSFRAASFFLYAALRGLRRERFGATLSTALWGLFACMIGVLDFADGLGRPLLTKGSRRNLVEAVAILCCLSLLWLRPSKKRKI